jgi:hypothetical protein
MLRFSVVLVAVLGLTGCCCTREARGPSSVCEVHYAAMRSVVVPGWGGCKLPTTSYAEARQKLFPHTYPFQLDSPWPWKRQRIYICDECVAGEKKWGLQQHTANHPAAGKAGFGLLFAVEHLRSGLPEPGRSA